MNQPDRSSWKVDVLLVGSWRGATSVLLSSGAHHFIVDTGMPHEAHLLVRALEERALRPEDIEGVINTHFHVDHVLNNSLFPGSLIYAPQESYDWCRALYSDLQDEKNWEKLALKYYPETAEYERAQTHMGKLRKLALRMWDLKRLGSPAQFRWTEIHRLPEGLAGLVTSGHVPGHLSLIIENAGQPTIIAGDALLSRDHDEQVLTMIPVNRKQFQLERRQILARGGRILPGHDREFAPPCNETGPAEDVTN
jgi:glyoxylase-like metal-dependent hydrolase (beta-lactamase superfamily II)